MELNLAVGKGSPYVHVYNNIMYMYMQEWNIGGSLIWWVAKADRQTDKFYQFPAKLSGYGIYTLPADNERNSKKKENKLYLA